MKFSQIFKEKYYNKLLTPNNGNPVRNRADSFLKIFEFLELKNKNFYTIIETGCMRASFGNLCFGDDGCSTYLFDEFINHYDGQLLSVDISKDNCEHAEKMVSKKTKITVSDSVKFLWDLNIKENIDFVYLDSFDVEIHDPIPSQLHHLKELCALINKLNKGTLIVIDDHDAFFTDGKIGKSQYVNKFMEDIGAKKYFEGYQIGWIL